MNFKTHILLFIAILSHTALAEELNMRCSGDKNVLMNSFFDCWPNTNYKIKFSTNISIKKNKESGIYPDCPNLDIHGTKVFEVTEIPITNLADISKKSLEPCGNYSRTQITNSTIYPKTLSATFLCPTAKKTVSGDGTSSEKIKIAVQHHYYCKFESYQSLSDSKDGSDDNSKATISKLTNELNNE
jgi:hypothetical protein